MKEVLIFHNREFGNWIRGIRKIPYADLELVAKIPSDNIDLAFALTQNLDELWSCTLSERYGAEFVMAEGPCRSTTAGDVLQVDSRIYVVGLVGFVEVVLEGSLLVAIKQE